MRTLAVVSTLVLGTLAVVFIPTASASETICEVEVFYCTCQGDPQKKDYCDGTVGEDCDRAIGVYREAMIGQDCRAYPIIGPIDQT